MIFGNLDWNIRTYLIAPAVLKSIVLALKSRNDDEKCACSQTYRLLIILLLQLEIKKDL
jgi:hypothetical protein